MTEKNELTTVETIRYLRSLGSDVRDNYFYTNIMRKDPIPHRVDPITKRKFFDKKEVDAWFKRRSK